MTNIEKDVLEHRIDELCAEIERIKTENTRLRNAVSEILDETWNKDYYTPSEWLVKELRELKIEVN